jgi:type IX secretion system PorP/SprF family membrane protein
VKARTTIITFLLFLAPYFALTQDFHFSGFTPGYTFANPSYAAVAASPEVGVTYRNQWPGMPVTFVTYGISLILPIDKMNSGAGINVLNDVQGGGTITRTYASATYGYGIEMGKDWKVSAGIGASWVFKKLDTEGLVFRSDILNGLGEPGYVTTYIEDYTKGYPDFMLGLTVSNTGSIMTGLSVSHITRPRESGSTQQERLPLKYMLFFSGKTRPANRARGISIEPFALFSLQGLNNELMWGFQAVYNSAFVIGGSVRQDLKFSYDALILSAGFYSGKYNFFYSYDVNLKKVKILSAKMAAHEVTFLYRFKYNSNGAVDCPAY